MEAILRGGGVSQSPVSPSIVCASSPNGASVAIESQLEVAAVLLHVLPVPGQVEDRVADELTGRVVRRLAAAVSLDELDVRAGGQVQLALIGAPAERDDGRMFQEQHRVGQLAGGDARRERALKLPGLEVRRHAEVRRLKPIAAINAAGRPRPDAAPRSPASSTARAETPPSRRGRSGRRNESQPRASRRL